MLIKKVLGLLSLALVALALAGCERAKEETESITESMKETAEAVADFLRETRGIKLHL